VLDLLLQKMVSPAKPGINLSRCAAVRNKNFPCSKCREICQAHAVEFNNNNLTINDQCTGCQLCTIVCPNRALTGSWNQLELISKGKYLSGPVTLGCSRGEENVNLTVPCLGLVSVETYLWFTLTEGDKQVMVNLEPCMDCSKSIQAMLSTRLGEVNQTLAWLGLAAENTTVSQWKPGIPVKQPSYSRRELFHAFKKESLAKTAYLVRAAMEEINEPGAGKLTRTDTPADRRLLLGVLESCQEELVVNKSSCSQPVFKDGLVSDECCLCNVCSSLCPFGAWEVLEQAGVRKLVYQPALCTGCGLCEFSCPQKAISLQEARELTFFAGQGTEKKVVETAYCQVCGEAIASGEGELCPTCAKQNLAANSLF
jgi:MinD superfamily P-loop ATPase